MLNTEIKHLISTFNGDNIEAERKAVLSPLIAYIRHKKENNKSINLNFICTHNSRRSHLTQIWAQAMAAHFGLQSVMCYSGGTEATAMFPKVVETLKNQGFEIIQLSHEDNPVYAIKHDKDAQASICFSKKYDHLFNPSAQFAAILTCDSADENCPVVIGAEARIPIKYNDPKVYDNTPNMNEKYKERSHQIGQELWWVFNEVGQCIE